MAIKLPVYMDYHATTPADPRVVEAMRPYFTEKFGNAASRGHAFGWAAEAAVDRARAQIAALIGAASPQEILFTSGATESDNLAIKGAAEAYRSKGDHIVTTAIEHKAVLDACKRLERTGFRVTYVPVDRQGLVRAEDVERALTTRTILVSVMLANNEIGTVQPLADIGRITRARGVLFHCDAAQGVGRVPFDVTAMHVDLASLSAHKVYGPKGVGALYVRRSGPRVRVMAQLDGGGHEWGMRSGTLNVPGIVGFGEAAELLRAEGPAEAERVRELRELLYARLTAALDAVALNGAPSPRLPGNLNLSFAGVEGESMLAALDDVSVSSGAACNSTSLEPSHVLRAIGVDDALARASLRFGLGRYTTRDEVEYAADVVVRTVRTLRRTAIGRAATKHRDEHLKEHDR